MVQCRIPNRRNRDRCEFFDVVPFARQNRGAMAIQENLGICRKRYLILLALELKII